MSYVVVTRLSVRRRHLVPLFLVMSLRVAWQAWRSPGFRGGYLRADARGGWWTVTTWDDARAMRAFTGSGLHARVAPKLAEWSDDAIFSGWQGDGVPSYREASRRTLADPTRMQLAHQRQDPTPPAAPVAATLPLPARRAAA